MIEAWYLLAFCQFRLLKYKDALTCCKNVKDLYIKQKCNDPELQAGTKEIYDEINKKLGRED